MNEKKQESLELYKENVAWLRRVIPRDDIYDFSEQILMGCDFLLAELGKHINYFDEAEKDKKFACWLQNMIVIRGLREQKYDGILTSKFKFSDEL